MNGKDLFEGLGTISQKYYDQAENGAIAPTRKSFRKPFLAAAIIAMMLLLTGCAVVYVLHLQDMKITEEPGIRYRNEEGTRIEPTEATLDVLSVRGYRGSSNHLATSAWYEFEHSYDTDGALAAANNSNEAGIPNEYLYPYGCYTQEMVDKVDEITETYGLKKLSAGFTVQRWQSQAMFDLLGIEGVCRGDGVKNVGKGAGIFYPEGNFKYEFEFLLNGGEEVWPYQLWATVYYTNMEYFDPDYISIDSDLYEEWNYQKADGTKVLLAMSRQGAFLFADQENAYMTVTINASGTTPREEPRHLSKADVELIAEAIDFNIHPQTVDPAEAEAALEQADVEHETKQAEADAKRAEGHASYADYITEKYINRADELAGTPFVRNYYALLDLNGDGVEELLLSDREDHFRDVLMIRDGKVVPTALFWATMNLCEGNVVRITGYDDIKDELRSYSYYLLDDTGEGVVSLEGISRSLETGIWQKDVRTSDERIKMVDLSDDEYKAILDKYPLADLEMKPIAEFPMN